MNCGELLRRAAGICGDKPALFEGTRRISNFGELDARAAAIAGYFHASLKLERGDRVVLFSGNSPSYIEAMFGCWYAGLIAVPVNSRLHTREVAHIIQDTEASLCLCDEAHAALALESMRLAGRQDPVLPIELPDVAVDATEFSGPASIQPGEIAWLFYTSGTTGRPKGAMLSHGNLVAMSLSYVVELDRIEPGDAIIHAAPLSHGSGLLLLPHVLRFAAQVVPVSGGFDPAETWELVGEHPRSTLFAAPTMIQRLVAFAEVNHVPIDSLKQVVVGGAPFYADDARRAIHALDGRVAQLYGQGETPMTIAVLPSDLYKQRERPDYPSLIGSVGYPHAILDVLTIDEAGQPCATGTVGEIIVRGPTVMEGYWRDPAATASALRDFWLYTGDLGSFDEQGMLTLRGRSKEVIISGGSNIYPREVEDILLEHPDVAEAAVVGRAHPEWGEEVVAFVVGRNGTSILPDDLDAWCLDRIARFKRPKIYSIVESLPHNAYGKVQKSVLIEQFVQHDAAEQR